MDREGEEDQDTDGWTHSWGTRAEPPSATTDDTPEIERDGEWLPRLSPGVGCDSTAQGNNVLSDCLDVKRVCPLTTVFSGMMS